jgi:hypothetical protein
VNWSTACSISFFQASSRGVNRGPQVDVVEAGAHQLHQQLHEPGIQVFLVEGAGLPPLLGGTQGGAVHALLALQQPAVGIVQHRQHQLLLALEVVADQGVVHAGVGRDVAHAEVGVALRR